jgi:hypothetical protein
MKVESTESRNYKKIEIDNAICKRRFHIAYEEGYPEILPKVQVLCPHCGVPVFEATNHPPAILTREENLVKSPDGTRPMIYDCKFLK